MTRVTAEERAELIELVRRLMSSDVYYPTEEAQDHAVAKFKARVAHPAAEGLISTRTPSSIMNRQLKRS
ncbi:hypothetical protein [Kribbella swartbergensis]